MELVSREEAKSAGEPHYFTGKPCKNGHIAKRYVSGSCVTCKLKTLGVRRLRKDEAGRRYKETPNATITALLSAAKQRSGKKGQEFDLTREWVAHRVNGGLCEATGMRFVLTLAVGASRNPWRPSIDKIDPARGYTQDNCRVVVSLFNFAKNEFHDEDVVAMARALIKRCRTPP